MARPAQPSSTLLAVEKERGVNTGCREVMAANLRLQAVGLYCSAIITKTELTLCQRGFTTQLLIDCNE